MPQVYNVLIATEFKNLDEESQKEIFERLEEHGLERIPTLTTAWEIKYEAEDETEAKDKALQAFTNVCRTYPFECSMLIHAGQGQILRRKKKFEA